MRKIINGLMASALCISVLFSASACKNTNLFETFNNAYNKTNSLEKVDCAVNLECKVEMDGSTIALNLESDGKEIRNDGKVVQSETKSKIKYLGNSTETYIYTDKDFAYTESFGTKTKIPLSELEYDTSISIDKLNFTEDILKDLNFSEENKIKTFTAKIDTKTFLTETLNSFLNENIDDDKDVKNKEMFDKILEEIIFDDISLQGKVEANGYLNYIKMDFGFTVSSDILQSAILGGITSENNDEMPTEATTEAPTQIKCIFSFDMTFNNPGQDFEITVPANLDEYKDSNSTFDFGNDEVPQI